MNENTIYYVIGFLVLVFLLIIIYYNYLYKYNEKQITVLTGPKTFNEDYQEELDITALTNNGTLLDNFGKGYGITLIWEMYIPNYPPNRFYNSSYNKLKPIIRFGDTPQIFYHPKNGYLSIILKYTDNPFYSNYPEIKIENIKLQKWQKYILVIQDRNINVFIDNKLVSSRTLMNVPSIDIYNPIKIGEINNNFLGIIKNMKLLTHPLSVKEIKLLN